MARCSSLVIFLEQSEGLYVFMFYFCLGNEVSGNPGQDDREVGDGHHGTSQGGPPGHDPSQEAPAEAPAGQRPDRTDGKYTDIDIVYR